mmetsp:Transcript_4245/g.8826  ORF Transcript_4245/g.8826 Transcript_4245/m.8826 type:complete len:232 (-) Transcript_4245:334-1029(-)
MVPTLVSPRPWMPVNTTSPLPSKSELRSLTTRWLSTKRWLRCTSVTMSPLISTDGFSPSTTTLVSEPVPLSTVPPSSNTRRPSVTVLETRLLEERSSRSKPTLSLSTTVLVVSKDVWLLSVTPPDTLPSAPEKVSTLPPSLAAWQLKKLSPSWKAERDFLPKKKSRRPTSRNTTAFTDLPTLSWTSCKRSSTPATEPERPSSNFATPSTSNKLLSIPTFTRGSKETTLLMT